ncbi:MAG: hypothetical protein J2P46_15500 [Zavarzinella sp.]|nr:hypothetical protein [Zavarzinella sp.]
MWTSALALALAGAIGSSPPPAPPPYPDLSEPKAAAFSLAVALARGDVKVAHEVYAGDDKEFLKYLDALAETRANVDRLNRAVQTRFGEFGAKAISGGTDFEGQMRVGDKGDAKARVTAVLALAEVKQEGDQAMLKLTKDFEVRLKKTDAGWKVMAWPPPNPLAYVIFQPFDATCKELAHEVEQGKYVKVYDVVAAFQRILGKHTAEMFKKESTKEGEPKESKKE